MDLLVDIGQADQLTTTRAENVVLHQKVKDLTQQVQLLTFANAALQAEVDLYRMDAAATSSVLAVSNMSLQESSQTSQTNTQSNEKDVPSDFLQTSGGESLAVSGYCCVPEYVFANLHQSINPVCITLSEDATLLISGAANGELMVMQWEAVVAAQSKASSSSTAPMVIDFLRTPPAESLSTTAANNNTPYCATATLDAPVVSVASVTLRRTCTVVAAGLMDGRVVLVTVQAMRSAGATHITAAPATLALPPRHSKYVTAVAWGRTSDSRVLLITASADGLLNVSSVTIPVLTDPDEEDTTPLVVQHLQSFHWDDAIPCLCFSRDCIYVYIRNTPHVTCIQVPVFNTAADETNGDTKEYVVTKLHLNAHAMDDHVSFAVLSLQPSPPCKHDSVGGRYLAAATDHGRHIILDTSASASATTTNTTSHIVKNLYGHQADGYSSPKIAWSRSGTLLYSNTQNEAQLLLYEIASGQLSTVGQPKSTPTAIGSNNAEPPTIISNSSIKNSSSSNSSSRCQEAIGGPHVRPIKDLFSSTCTNMVVTTSFDRNVVVWLPASVE